MRQPKTEKEIRCPLMLGMTKNLFWGSLFQNRSVTHK